MLRVLLQPVQRAVSAFFPSGGKTGQLLRKKSDADNDVEWVDAPDVGTIIVDQELDTTSANPVSNAAVTEAMSWHHIS